jgi:hypothetical protein
MLMYVKKYFFSYDAAEQYRPLSSDDLFTTSYPYIFSFTFLLPLLGVLVSQALNDQFHIARYDAPSRYALALIIFFALTQFKNIA